MNLIDRFRAWLLRGVVQAAPVPVVDAPNPMKISAAALADAQASGAPIPDLWVMPKPFGPAADRMVAMDSMDPGTNALYAEQLNGAFSEGLGFLGYPYLAELTQRSEYRHIAETYAREATRKWIEIKGADADYIQKLEDALKKFKVRDVIREGVQHDCFFGRAQIFIDLGAAPMDRELSRPLMLRPEKIGKGKLKSFRVVEPLWSYPGPYDASNPLARDFYRPRSWQVQSASVHATRLMTLVGRPMPDILKPAYQFGGLSMSQMAKPYVDNWLRARQSVSDLLNSFSTMVLSTDMSIVLSGGGAESMLNRAQLFNQARDNRGLMLVDKDREELSNVSTPLGTLDKLQAQAQEQIASVTGIPLVVLLGVTPSGLNASSDGEIKTFYATIHGYQERVLREPLETILKVVQLSEFGTINESLTFDFVDLNELDAVTAATVEKTKADIDAVYIGQGVVTPEETRERLANDDASPYASVDLSGPAPEPPADVDEEDADALAAGDDPEDDGSDDSPPGKRKPADSGQAADEEHWITAHPNGKEHDGTPLLIEGTKSTGYRVKGGAGGKLDGKEVKPGSMSKPRGSKGGEGPGGAAAGGSDPASGPGAGGSSTSEEPKRTKDDEAKEAIQTATQAFEKAKTADEWDDVLSKLQKALDASREAMAEAKESGDAAAKEAAMTRYYDLFAMVQKAQSKRKAAEKKTKRDDFKQGSSGQNFAAIEKRFEKGTSEEIGRDLKEKYGLNLVNGSNAVRDYKKFKTEYYKTYRTMSPEEYREAGRKLSELQRAAMSTNGARVRGHTEYDIDDGSPQAKAARKAMGHVGAALDYLSETGFDIKAALSKGNVAYQPGNVGKSLGHAFQRGGVGYFTMSAGKNSADYLLAEQKSVEARRAAGKPRWTVSSDQSPDIRFRTTAIHELAHALGLQPHINSPAKLSKLLEEHIPVDWSDKKSAYEQRRDWIRNNISEYATANIHETDAELAALVTSPGYARGSLPKPFEDHVDELFSRRKDA